jgi:hypothetical protein
MRNKTRDNYEETNKPFSFTFLLNFAMQSKKRKREASKRDDSG